MIQGIYVLFNSGICLYNKSLLKISQNNQLIAGFFIALDRFCATTIGENISYFCTHTLKFHFIHERKLLFVFINDKNDVTKNLLPQFEKLIKKFYTEFSDHLSLFEKQGVIPELTKFEVSFSNLYF